MTLPDFRRLAGEIAQHRAKWAHAPRPKEIEPVGPGEESVWDFPRPPRVETVSERLRATFAGETIAETDHGLRVVETAGAPVYFFPPEAVAKNVLAPVPDHWTFCEWKGAAIYFDLVVGAQRSKQAAFAYPEPLDDLGQGYARLAGWIAFYANRVDAAFIGDERATPQPGGYYAGWVTTKLKGPIKGAPGSSGW